MSLTARIPLRPSRRIEAVERVMPMGGLLVAATTAILRLPAATAAWIAVAGVAAVAFAYAAAVRRRRTRRLTLAVSDRGALDLATDAGDLPGPWHLAETTVAWPGFAMVALASDGTARVALRRAVFAAEQRPDERWALQRFLTWSLRARGGSAGNDESTPR